MESIIKNNVVSTEGMIVTPFKFSHEVFGNRFYTASLGVPRLSGQNDEITIMIPECLIDVNADMTGAKVRIQGQFRSYNQHENEKNHLVLSVFVREIEVMDTEWDINGTKNEIYLNGYICKPPVYRKTPLGRKITDLLVAVNRPYGKSDYIPCVAWGRNAHFSADFEVGTHVEIMGRVQSREYIKKFSETEFEKRVAFEMSIGKLNEIPDFNEEPAKEEGTQKDVKDMVS